MQYEFYRSGRPTCLVDEPLHSSTTMTTSSGAIRPIGTAVLLGQENLDAAPAAPATKLLKSLIYLPLFLVRC